MTRPRLDSATGCPLPPTSWFVAKAALKVLASMSPTDRAVLLSEPESSRSWHLFRDQLSALDRAHKTRSDWLHGPDPTTGR